MAKKKKKQDMKSEGSMQLPSSPAQQHELSRIPSEVFDVIGSPIVAALLVDGRIPETSRALLSADTMHANSVSTGVVCGIALGDCPVSAPSNKQASGFAPASNAEDLLALTPVCVSEALGAVPNKDVADYILVGELWPGVKLQKGAIQLSGALLGAMGHPPVGSTILIYKLEFAKESVACKLNLSVVFRATDNEDSKQSLVVSGRDRSEISSPAALASGGSALPQSKEQVVHRADPKNKQVEWLQDTLNQPSARQTKVLSEVVLRQLNERWLLQHSYVPITLLGSSVLVKVDTVVGNTHSDELKYFHVIGSSTKVVFAKTQSSSDHPGDTMSTDRHRDEKADTEFLEKVREHAIESLQGSSRDVGGEAAVRSARNGLNSMKKIINENLGGLFEYQKLLQSLIIMPLKHPEIFQLYGLKPPKGVIFHGPPGTGKTFLACEAARQAGAQFFVVNGPDVMSEFYGGSEASLSAVFRAAQACSPSVIFLDEVDALMPSREHNQGGLVSSGATSTSSRLVTALLVLMDGMEKIDTSGNQVVVIAATNRLDSVDPALRRPGRFDREIVVGVPSPHARGEILKARLRSMHHGLSESQVEGLAASAHGFVTADLSALCREAAMIALRRWIHDQESKRIVCPEDFQVAQTRIRPSAMREISVQVPNVRWQDVGGLTHVKQQLKEAVEWPISHAESLARLGAKPPGGVLLYGPPGCSKTLLARAIATETKMNFLSVKGSELLSTYVGESEKAITMLFSRARQLAPCIVFFDELDGLAGTREGDTDGGTGVGQRVITQLLTELDGVRDRGLVVVIGATNKPRAIDSALLRPGRFDRLVYVPPPDPEGRKAVFQICLRDIATEAGMDLDHLAGMTEGYTGADIAAVCREAGLAALDEDLAASAVAMRHLLEAVSCVPPSVPSTSQELADFISFQRGAPAGPREDP